MQDRYAGDIGDYGKFGMLRALHAEGFAIGINWYKTAPLKHEYLADGRFRQADGKYRIPDSLSVCDAALSEALRAVFDGEQRSIAALETADLIPDAVYYSKEIPVDRRQSWHEEALLSLSSADLVFLDPDNGLLVKSVGKFSAKSVKYALYEEAADYVSRNQSVVIYNHRCRKKPDQYFNDILLGITSVNQMRSKRVFAVTFPKGSVRDYFAVCANDEHAAMVIGAFERLVGGIWGHTGMCALPSFMSLYSVP